MKKTTVLMAFLLLNMFAYAQNIGIRVGRNVSNYSFNKDSLSTLGITKENLAGLAVAIPIEFKMNKNFSIQTDLGFLQKGFKSVQNLQAGSMTIQSELKNYTNYVILPVMLRLNSSGRVLQAYANIGPDASYAINSTSKGNQNVSGTKTEISEDVPLEGSKRFTVGLQGGAGLKLKLGKIALVLDSRFITDLQDNEGNFNVQGLKDKAFSTKNWVTSFGFVFGR